MNGHIDSRTLRQASSNSRPHWGLREAVIALSVLALLAAMCLLLRNKAIEWYWSVDREWARRVKLEARPIVSALERYREISGSYPEDIQELFPDYLSRVPPLPLHSKRGREGHWIYSLLEDGQYELGATCMHWISSYDALLRRPTGQYPDNWKTENYVFPMEEWLYVVGTGLSPASRRAVYQYAPWR